MNGRECVILSTIDQKQVKQSFNIVNTLIEAAEHFQELIKQKELHQSIFILGSIVDGVQALNQNGYIDSTHQNLSRKLEKNILLITKNLESASLIKVLEVSQFSLIPNLKKLKQLFQSHIQDTEEKVISIGIYGIQNPLLYYPQARIDALVKESEKQNAILYFFGDNDVNFSEETIQATFYQNGGKKNAVVPFPDVINNTSVKKTHISRKLHRVIPFTNYFHVGNKISLPTRLVNAKNKYVKLLIPFYICNNIERIHEFLNQNQKVVFKNLNSNRGEQIYFVTKKKQRYILLDQKKETILTADGFDQWLNDLILIKRNTYIVQKYVHTRTKENEPYHIRAHVQKDHNGKWVLTHIYPRIGNRKSNLSNISTEGRIENFKNFLIEQYGESQGKKYHDEILNLSIDVAWNLDKLYGMAIDELGIDFAIDDKGKIWMHEANNGPQTAFHEDKRAVNVIGYAKYIYQNGIMYSLHSNNIHLSNHFNARTSTLGIRKQTNRKILGMIVPSIKEVTPLQRALVEASQNEKIDICLIQPNDIDSMHFLIRGHFFEDDQWKPYICNYPDIIYDCLKVKDDEEQQFIYEEFEDIPFLNNWSDQILNKVDFLNRLKENQILNQHLLDHSRIKVISDIFQWTKNYQVIKLTNETSNQYLYINQTSNNIFQLISKKGVKVYSKAQLTNYLQESLVDKRIIIEAMPYEFPIQQYDLHLLKNIETNEWLIVDLTIKNCSKPDELYQEPNTSILNTNESNHDTKNLCDHFLTYSHHIANALQEDHSELILTELSLTFDLYADQKIAISNIVPDHPAFIINHDRYAELLLQLGKQLLLFK